MDIEKKRNEKKRENEFDRKYGNRAEFFSTERRKPAQKPTPMSPSHGRNFGEVLQNAAIRSAILAHHKILMKHKYFRPRSHRVEVAAVGDPRSDGDFYSRPRTPGLCPPTHSRVFFLSYPYSARIYRDSRRRGKDEEEEKNRRREREEKKKEMRREESKNVRTPEKNEAEKKRTSVRCNGTDARLKKMKLERKDGHGKEKRRKEKIDPESKTRLEFDREDLGKILKNAAICSYFRPRSHRVEVAAAGDPRTNGDSTCYYCYYYQESKATGRPPLPTNSSLQTLKLQPHASPHLGTDLRIAQLSNIGSFDHHSSTTDRAFATNAGTQNRIYRSHDTYASIPEILTRVC
ncbi:LOW QUALITY PROTEIN: hypothetical protein V1477_007472 [Vespula maculifrons]|uniref:Uncharacterized protein n=1 Tax=Vespula maculifrons TaxID=7453 RepID=A0ABD2CIL9_VESMC